MTEVAVIFVSVLDEAVDAWRPVTAACLRDNVYRIVDQTYGRGLERWEFEPADQVVCVLVDSGECYIFVATSRV